MIDGFVSPSTSVSPMFPFYENSATWDDFGEVINPDDYVIKEENMDQSFLQVYLSSFVSVTDYTQTRVHVSNRCVSKCRSWLICENFACFWFKMKCPGAVPM